MKVYRNKKKRLSTKYLLLIMTLGCVIVIFASLTLNISGGPLNAVAGYVFVPMQKGINITGERLQEQTKNLQTLSEVQAENEKLKSEVADLTSQLNTIRLEKYELNNLRTLLELDEKYPSYEKVGARVIAKDSGNWFSSFTIDKGSKDGLTVGMNIMSGCGLVGIITDVGPNFSKVRTIINDATNVSGMVTTTQDNLNVSGNLQTMKEKQVITFNELRDKEDKVQVGDPVVTSYVSDQYQQGILIGYISTIETNPNNLTKSGTITPVVDFEHIEEVLVIKNVKETGNDLSEPANTESTESTESDTQQTDTEDTQNENQ